MLQNAVGPICHHLMGGGVKGGRAAGGACHWQGAGRDKICNPLVAATRGGGKNYFWGHTSPSLVWVGWCQWPTRTRLIWPATWIAGTYRLTRQYARASALVVLSHLLHPTLPGRLVDPVAPTWLLWGSVYVPDFLFISGPNVRPDSETNSGPAQGVAFTTPARVRGGVMWVRSRVQIAHQASFGRVAVTFLWGGKGKFHGGTPPNPTQAKAVNDLDSGTCQQKCVPLCGTLFSPTRSGLARLDPGPPKEAKPASRYLSTRLAGWIRRFEFLPPSALLSSITCTYPTTVTIVSKSCHRFLRPL